MATATPSNNTGAAAERTNRPRCLERMFEPQKGNKTFAAERQIEAGDEGAVAMEAEADAVRRIEVAERDPAPLVGDCAGIDEQRAVERPPGFPAVLGADEHRVLVAEAELAEAAKRPRPAERRLEVERNLLPVLRIREDARSTERDRPIAVGNRNVLLKLD